jgi:serine/threonine protein kinase
MTVLPAPTRIIPTVTYPAGPTAPAHRQPRQRLTTTHSGTRSGHGELTNAECDALTAADTLPLRGTDPVSVDGYRMVSRLGSGGMAEVYLAVSPADRPVAVKVLRRDHADAGAAETCHREYRLSAAVDAACTAPALGHGTSTAGAYLVTAYLPGYRSATALVRGPTPIERLWRFGSALARTLAAVHDRGVVHCDVKPSNLLIRGNDVRIIDFGIARYVGERSADGVVQCSRGWAAPEQLSTAPATPAVDTFAWGCLLARLASGVHPFASHSEQEWILRLQSAQPELSGLPPDLDEVVRWTLARDPRDRPTAPELATICRTRVRAGFATLDAPAGPRSGSGGGGAAKDVARG